jgi:hypothetical protein
MASPWVGCPTRYEGWIVRRVPTDELFSTGAGSPEKDMVGMYHRGEV